jgi:hypothetical protein
MVARAGPHRANRHDCRRRRSALGLTPLSLLVGVTAGLVRRLPAVMEVERDAKDERGEGDVPAA